MIAQACKRFRKSFKTALAPSALKGTKAAPAPVGQPGPQAPAPEVAPVLVPHVRATMEVKASGTSKEHVRLCLSFEDPPVFAASNDGRASSEKIPTRESTPSLAAVQKKSSLSLLLEQQQVLYRTQVLKAEEYKEESAKYSAQVRFCLALTP